MVRVLASSVLDPGSLDLDTALMANTLTITPGSQTKDNKIGICCFSFRQVTLRSNSKDWIGSKSG